MFTTPIRQMLETAADSHTIAGTRLLKRARATQRARLQADSFARENGACVLMTHTTVGDSSVDRTAIRLVIDDQVWPPTGAAVAELRNTKVGFEAP